MSVTKWAAVAGAATIAAIGVASLVIALRSGDDEPVKPPPAPEATAVSAPGFGPPITAADVSASLPATRDGRRLWPEGTWGERIVLNAERPVPVLPGEPVGQEPNRYDQQFLAWDADSNNFQPLWTNESGRYESVLSTDGDWALSELYKNNPQSQWELRLHNMATGELRTLDAETAETRGTTPSALTAARVVADSVLWVNAVVEDGHRFEQMRMYAISTGKLSIIDSVPVLAEQRSQSPFYPGGIDGDTVAYLRKSPRGPHGVVLRSVANGTERELAPPAGTLWEAISPDAKFAVARQEPAPTVGSGPEGPRFAVNLETGEVRRFAEGQSYGFGLDFADGYVSWQVPAADNAVNGFYSLDSGLARILDPSVPVDGQGARVFDGWFFWRERAPGAPAASNDRANGILRFIRLP